MTDHDFFPPLLDLAPDEIRAHRQHLLGEIGSEPRRAKRTRMLGIAAGAVAAAAAIAVALAPTSGGRSPLGPRSAATPFAPLYSFHASVSSAPGDERVTPTGLGPIEDSVIPLVDGVAFSRTHIPRAVLALAAAQARSYGNRGPTLVEWAKTTRQEAVSAENAGRVDGGNLPVYFVILHGHFVDNSAPRPPGGQPPRGSILTDTIEIKTGRILDFGISKSEPNFSKIGKPHQFVLYGHRRSQ